MFNEKLKNTFEDEHTENEQLISTVGKKSATKKIRKVMATSKNVEKVYQMHETISNQFLII